MTHHLSFENLCDLADDAMDASEMAVARGHIAACATCATQLAELTQLHVDAAALPREVPPPADLWRDIKRDLSPQRSRGLARWHVRHLAAAALLIAVGSSATTALVLRGEPASATQPVADATEYVTEVSAPLPARLASAEDGYSRSVRVLQATLDERRDSLAPSTIATVERSLRVADSAIAEAREALARDPANTALARLFASNYERKIDLLRRATELSPRT